MDTRYSIAAALTCGTVAFTAYYLLCRYNTCQVSDTYWPVICMKPALTNKLR